jgi:hypothetical protein
MPAAGEHLLPYRTSNSTTSHPLLSPPNLLSPHQVFRTALIKPLSDFPLMLKEPDLSPQVLIS